MALVIEDGSGVEGANSYETVDNARAYAVARGLSFPAHTTEGDAAAEILLTKGFDYLEARRSRYQGAKTDPAQDTQWPRTGVVIDGIDFPSDAIPKELRFAQTLLAVKVQTQPLTVDSDGKEIIRKKIEGAVETQFAPTGNAAPQPIFPDVEALLEPLCSDGSAFVGAFLTTERV